MKEIEELVAKLGLDKQLRLDEIPRIDLYMDQVIQLFENKYADTKRNEEEKILTKTMINNYAKGDLFFPVKKKKYTRDHLVMISMIYQLKGALSINDIKGVLEGINNQAVRGELNLSDFYSIYLDLCETNTEDFMGELAKRYAAVNDKCETNSEDVNRKVLLIASLVHMSNMYRRVAEKIADELLEKNSGEK
ncbi:DUF1836 domain-containing protein [Bacillus sp. EB01]|uniref:DUF1836 domain-containing protein n=1 Tax=Bacillus sp. EB01 TaxID=1347086 RepID=UPI0005C6F209|nr:DUF1836 domain-containing protein [Bacillus sp. EB01]